MALITVDKGIAATSCFEHIKIKETEMFVLVDEFEISSRESYKVEDVKIEGSRTNIYQCSLAVVIVSNLTKNFRVLIKLAKYYLILKFYQS